MNNTHYKGGTPKMKNDSDVRQPIGKEESVEKTHSIEEDKVVETSNLTGVVRNCEKLNIRSKPEKDPNNIVRVVDEGTEVTIDMTHSNKEWYKVYNDKGIDGFCMKDFITLN